MGGLPRGGAWGSALSADAFAAIRSVGFEPLGPVFGAAVYPLLSAAGACCPGVAARDRLPETRRGACRNRAGHLRSRTARRTAGQRPQPLGPWEHGGPGVHRPDGHGQAGCANSAGARRTRGGCRWRRHIRDDLARPRALCERLYLGLGVLSPTPPWPPSWGPVSPDCL